MRTTPLLRAVLAALALVACATPIRKPSAVAELQIVRPRAQVDEARRAHTPALLITVDSIGGQTGAAHWVEPVAWNAAAASTGATPAVMTSILSDVFDAEAPPDALARLWNLIRDTPHLRWHLLTKRPENIAARLPAFWPLANVWLGVSVEDQRRANERLRDLLALPVEGRRFWMNAWPLLERVEIAPPLLERMRLVSIGPEDVGPVPPDSRTWALELADAAHAAGAVVHHSLERGVHTAWRPRPTEAEGAKA